MGTTKDNLEHAFAGESQASRKYLYFAEKAEKEGHRYIARLFRAASEAETVHARNHLNIMQGILSTRENLIAAMGGEQHEFTEMYPGFITQAKSENNNEAVKSFDMANKVEQIHHKLYASALSMLENGQPVKEQLFYVCQYCGNTVEGEVPERCPVCGMPRKIFKQVD